MLMLDICIIIFDIVKMCVSPMHYIGHTYASPLLALCDRGYKKPAFFTFSDSSIVNHAHQTAN